MARFERAEGKGVLLWILERRGSVLWVREGKAGGNGRIAMKDLGSEAAAAGAAEEQIAERLRSGYVLTGADVGVSAPFRSRAQLERAARSSAKNALGFDVRELERALASALAQKVAMGPVLVRDVVDTFVVNVAEPCTSRLAALSFHSNEDGSRVGLGARFTRGSGANPDDHDEDGYRVSIALGPHGRDDLEERFDFDRFAEDQRQLSPASIAVRYRRALEDLDVWHVLEASVTRDILVESA